LPQCGPALYRLFARFDGIKIATPPSIQQRALLVLTEEVDEELELGASTAGFSGLATLAPPH
jgi:hypothetical protein